MISIPQLRDEGYRFTLLEHSWRIHRGSLVIARGARCGTNCPLHIFHVQDGVVSMTPTRCSDCETRTVSFQDALIHGSHDIVLPFPDEQKEPIVHDLSVDRHVESSDSSMDAREGPSHRM